MSNIIVGGGITGLYLGYRLQQKFPEYPITIIEKTGRLGGRVNTISKNNLKYDIGAARYSYNHLLCKNLIRDLGLSQYVYPNRKTAFYYVDKKLLKNEKDLLAHYNITKYKSIKALWKHVFSKLSDYSNKYLLSKTVHDILKELLTSAEVELLIKSFLYNTKMFYSNAYTTFISMIYDYDILENRMYGLKGGTEIIIDKLKQSFLKNGGHILLHHDVSKINKTCINVSNNGLNFTIKFKKLFLCVTNFDLLHVQNVFNIFEKNQMTRSLRTGSLMRIYAKYKPINKTSWFSNIPKVLTDTELQFIIPIDPKTGLIMISYSTDILADYWNQLGDKDAVKNKIEQILNTIFPKINIPPPEWISIHYWNKGIHYWSPKYNPDKVDKILHKFDNIHILGEAFSKHQSWMEGGLRMVEDLLKTNLSLSTINIKKTVLQKKSAQKTPDMTLPIITLSELNKHTTKESLWAYITDPHTSLNYVYDFTDWIDKHPGGAAHILSIGGKNATKKFYEQSAHPIDKIEKVIFPKYRIGILEGS